MIKDIEKNLDTMFPNPVCELDYNKDYELLIATVLSAQSTDKRVNIVTKELFEYTIEELRDLEIKKLEKIIMTVGTFHKKAIFIKEIAKSLLENYNGVVPNNRVYLETLPGVGRKTASVVLANLFNEPSIAVDTHVTRVSNVLGIVKNEYDVLKIEKVIMKKFNKESWNRINSQLVLFGRYICKAKKQACNNCLFNSVCKKK